MRAFLEYDMTLVRVESGKGVTFASPPNDYLYPYHEWGISMGEWYAMGRPVDITVRVEFK